jgi:hypothetical protein
MTTLNSYATLAQYKAYVTARGQTSTTDAGDDAVIEQLLKSVSRYIDGQTGRHFFPKIETRYYDVPFGTVDNRALYMDGDLLEVIELVNGDGITVPSTDYSLRPKNGTPYTNIRLVDNSTYYWASDGAGSVHDVIEVTGVWAFHNDYSNAWLLGSTLAEDLDTSETGTDVTSGTLFAIGDLIRFDNELAYVSAKATNTLTNTRGANGSTAATHDTGEDVFIWQVMEDLKTAVLETAMQAYKRRYGTSGQNTATITGAGVVLSPKDIPTIAAEFCRTYRRYV